MTALRVLSIFGTRPEAIKMAPVVHQLSLTPGVESLVCVTAQHREMLDQVLSIFAIQPDIDLNLMRDDQSLADLTASIFTHLDPVLKDIQPNWVLAEGDTTTVAATALLAYYNRLKFGHVEAGLRTGDKWQPFPEEINRMIAGVVADLHFAPTERSAANLKKENIPPEKIIVTGNTVIDALLTIVSKPISPEIRALLLQLHLPQDETALARDIRPRLILVTAHRRENFGAPLENICAALKRLAEIYRNEVQIVYLVHLNPHVHETVHRLLSEVPNISLLPPLAYLPLVNVLKRAYLVLTDSGGLQEEAPSLGVPVLVLREVTERPEGIDAGTLRLVGTNPDRIVAETRRLLDDPEAHQRMAKAVNPFGDGHASERIVAALLRHR
ncbi:MAG TPA: UDP-N-acetylglucosamine 2-epimerase (non-hydrolyzing) [Anaerolineales bacterium]|nr:UDP-N-acetylglucosamine 2-epimerase (non-hydrolyzing) [Anaerolineales bacterium]